MNGEYTCGFKLNAGESLNNGKIKLVMIKKKNPIASLFTFIKLFMFGIKSIRKSKCAVVKDVSSLEIQNHSNVAFTFDGEKLQFLKKKVTVASGLKFICK